MNAQGAEHAAAILRTRRLLLTEGRAVASRLYAREGRLTTDTLQAELISVMNEATPRSRLVPWSVTDAETTVIIADVVSDILSEMGAGAR